jgi:hypothetical protein
MEGMEGEDTKTLKPNVGHIKELKASLGMHKHKHAKYVSFLAMKSAYVIWRVRFLP